jgi:hypothetical protein
MIAWRTATNSMVLRKRYTAAMSTRMCVLEVQQFRVSIAAVCLLLNNIVFEGVCRLGYAFSSTKLTRAIMKWLSQQQSDLNFTIWSLLMCQTLFWNNYSNIDHDDMYKIELGQFIKLCMFCPLLRTKQMFYFSFFLAGTVTILT